MLTICTRKSKTNTHKPYPLKLTNVLDLISVIRLFTAVKYVAVRSEKSPSDGSSVSLLLSRYLKKRCRKLSPFSKTFSAFCFK